MPLPAPISSFFPPYGGKEAVSCMPMGPQTQPLAGISGCQLTCGLHVQTGQQIRHRQGFESRLGEGKRLGHRFDKYDLSLATHHYSNGGTSSPNQGENFLVLGLGREF